MLYFCSVEEIQNVLQSANRFTTDYDNMRKAVTVEMNNYMRRNLEYATGLVEYHTPQYGAYNIWLNKRNIDPGSVEVAYSFRGEWDENVLTAADYFELDAAKGVLRFHGLPIATPLRSYVRSLRVSYNGGYSPLPVSPATDPVTFTDVIAAPSGLRQAAINECVFRLDKLLNINVGNSEDVDKGQRVAQRKFIGGFLADTAMAMTEYRKPLGG